MRQGKPDPFEDIYAGLTADKEITLCAKYAVVACLNVAAAQAETEGETTPFIPLGVDKIIPADDFDKLCKVVVNAINTCPEQTMKNLELWIRQVAEDLERSCERTDGR